MLGGITQQEKMEASSSKMLEKHESISKDKKDYLTLLVCKQETYVTGIVKIHPMIKIKQPMSCSDGI
jgi:hypothetical protein